MYGVFTVPLRDQAGWTFHCSREERSSLAYGRSLDTRGNNATGVVCVGSRSCQDQDQDQDRGEGMPIMSRVEAAHLILHVQKKTNAQHVPFCHCQAVRQTNCSGQVRGGGGGVGAQHTKHHLPFSSPAVCGRCAGAVSERSETPLAPFLLVRCSVSLRHSDATKRARYICIMHMLLPFSAGGSRLSV